MRSCLSIALILCSIATCSAQVVQLPAVSNFQINTSVSVPDQGTGSLGGVGRSSSGVVSRGAGPMASVSRGGVTSANSAAITATIIDLAAMDEALLNMAPARDHRSQYPASRKGTKIVNTLTPHHYDREIKRAPAQPHPTDWMMALGPQGNVHVDSAEYKVRDGSNARYFMEMAADAHAHNHDSAARVYYQMAVERMTPAQRKRMEEIKVKRAEEANKFKKSKNDAKTTAGAAGGAAEPGAATPADPNSAGASPFDQPAADAGAKTDMTSSPF